MVNALRLAARVVSALPVDNLAPEATDGRDGYIHPYVISGSPARAEIHLILRDFDDDLLDSHAALLERTAHQIVDAEPRAGLEIRLREQYRNMRRHVEPLPRLVEVAAEAMRMEGIEPIRTAIRGGTDGSQLSARGLPTPNIFDGGHEYHSVREWVSLQDMAAAAATLVHMAALWSEPAAQ
jgi:tripeptide aminopeptidase